MKKVKVTEWKGVNGRRKEEKKQGEDKEYRCKGKNVIKVRV